MADSQAGQTPATAQKTVMIVEDNDLNMKLFHDLLEAHGYRTVQCRLGREAYDLAQAEHPDLIVMDIQLPEVSGLEVTQRIKADPALRHIPIIVLTAHAMRGDEERARACGCDDFLTKPIDETALFDKIGRHLGR